MAPFHTETMATPAMAMTPLPLLSIRELNDEVLECRIVLRLAGVGRVWNQPRKNNPFLHAASRARGKSQRKRSGRSYLTRSYQLVVSC
jgi:hypothetical protein